MNQVAQLLMAPRSKKQSTLYWSNRYGNGARNSESRNANLGQAHQPKESGSQPAQRAISLEQKET